MIDQLVLGSASWWDSFLELVGYNFIEEYDTLPRVVFFWMQGEIGVALCDAKSLSTTQPEAMTLLLMIEGTRKISDCFLTTYDDQFPIFV